MGLSMPENDMEKDWDARARQNAQHYIASGKIHWSEDEFFGEGTRLAYQLCNSLFQKEGFQPKGKRMLDIGCGIGRLERGFSQMFGGVWGVDVSGEMISQAIKLNQGFENVKFVKGNGQDLSAFADEFFDFVFSTITFQHIPKKRIILNYFREIHRVLKSGGLFKLQVREPWAGAAFAFGFIPVPRFIFPYIPEAIWAIYEHLAFRGKKKLYRGKSWRGSGMSENEAREALLRLQFKVVEIEKASSEVTFWCCGRK